MEVKRIAVVGAGTMGSGIALVAAQSGFDVSLKDADPLKLAQGFAEIDGQLKKLMDKGKLTEADGTVIRGRISAHESLEGVAQDAHLVIEATTEDAAIKKALFRRLDELIEEPSILASNTAGLSISELASVTSRPDRFIGMHFFNPVPVMKLVEIIRGHATSDETTEIVKGVARQMGKTPLEVEEAPGFLVARLLIPMINEAIFVLQEGLATAEEIDEGMKLGANHPMGPLTLADLIGLDRLLSIQQSLYEEFADSKYRPANLLVKMVRAGRLGRKSGKGFFDYS
jgi:3-hydroxybutyryl-CoA dehydrogenase